MISDIHIFHQLLPSFPIPSANNLESKGETLEPESAESNAGHTDEIDKQPRIIRNYMI